jgi:hypothetical protein
MYIQDESVQSWFFRQGLISGESKFGSVIGTDGKWYFTPCMLKEWIVNLDSIPDLDLLRFLRKSGIANKKAGMFDNPVDYLEQMSILDPIDKTDSLSKGQIPIRYCKECIEEAIKEIGYGYLKATWLSNIHCSVHDVNLTELTTKSRKDTVIEINLALAGLPTFSSKKSVVIDNNKSLYTEIFHLPPYHIMPCLLIDFYMWASKENDDPQLKYEHLDFLYVYGVKKDFSDRKLHQKYLYFKETFPKQFEEFLDRAAEIKEFRFSFRKKLSLSETLLKSKNKNCSKCSRWGSTDHCPIKPIKIEYLYNRLDNLPDSNPCDFFLKYGRQSFG